MLGLVIVMALVGTVAVAMWHAQSDERGRPAAALPKPATAPAASPVPKAPVAPPPPEVSAPCDPAAAVAQLPLRRRLAQLIMVGVDPRDPGPARDLVATEQVGGILVGGSATGLLRAGALAQVQQVAQLPVAVAVDDEGGRVQRFDEIAGSIPSAREMAATMTPQQVYELARERGEVLRSRGVTVDLAPTVDVSNQPDDDVIGDRSFAADPEVVIRYAAAFAQGLRDSGVLPVFKHFPGHGRADGDSHEGAVRTPPVPELQAIDMVPYRRLLGSGADAVMVGHLDVPGLTAPATPASISPGALALLRDDVGYRGLVMTDDLGAMRAISDRMSLPEAVRRSLAAGVDIALWTSGDPPGAVLDHLEQAVGTGALPQSRVDDAAQRVLLAKGIDPCRLS
ncbi:MAG: glycoside hydrolase family 3 N-terminal domain-containing protein [Pseudonocardiaceae bacterium]